jgi:hypothetical protein
MNRTLVIAIIGLILAGCSGDKIEDAGFSMITGRPVGYSALCERIENVKVIDRINKTAGALKHPAYVIGYSFDCLSSLTGKSRDTLYIGFVANKDKGTYECIHHHKDKNAVLSNNWYMCGGLN